MSLCRLKMSTASLIDLCTEIVINDLSQHDRAAEELEARQRRGEIKQTDVDRAVNATIAASLSGVERKGLQRMLINSCHDGLVSVEQFASLLACQRIEPYIESKYPMTRLNRAYIRLKLRRYGFSYQSGLNLRWRIELDSIELDGVEQQISRSWGTLTNPPLRPKPVAFRFSELVSEPGATVYIEPMGQLGPSILRIRGRAVYLTHDGQLPANPAMDRWPEHDEEDGITTYAEAPFVVERVMWVRSSRNNISRQAAPSLTRSIRAAITASNLVGTPTEKGIQPSMNLAILDPPTNVAFDVIWRIQGIDYRWGQIACRPGEWVRVRSLTKYDSIPTATTEVQVLLKASDKAAAEIDRDVRRTKDSPPSMRSIWDGEIDLGTFTIHMRKAKEAKPLQISD